MTIAGRSSSRTSSRTWAPSSSGRSPRRPTTSPATAPRRRPCWPRRSSPGPQERRRRRQPDGPEARHREGRRPGRRAHRRDSPRRSPARTRSPTWRRSPANDDEIGDELADAIKKVGKDGVITVEEGKRIGTTSTSSRACSSTAATSPALRHRPGRMRPSWRTLRPDPHEKITPPTKLSRCSRRSSRRPTAADHRRGRRGRGAGDAGRQQARGIFNGVAVKAPGYGDRRKAMLEDIAILTGGEAIFKDLGIDLENAQLSQLGRATKASTRQHHDRRGRRQAEEIKGRIEQISRDRHHRQRLRPREAPGAPREAGRRRRRRSTSAPRPRPR